MRAETTSKAPIVSRGHIRILIADDHEVVRLGIRNLLEAKPNWTVCAEATDGRDAVAKAVQFHPDIIIMDLTMPSMNGLEAARHIAQSQPEIPVILFSLHVSDELTGHFESGSIRGAVCKSNAARDLVEAVDRVLNGATFFPERGAVSALPHSR